MFTTIQVIALSTGRQVSILPSGALSIIMTAMRQLSKNHFPQTLPVAVAITETLVDASRE